MRLAFLKRQIIVLALSMLGLAFFAPDAFAELTAKANHDNVEINLNYHGSSVSVSGQCDPGADLFIKVTATGSEQKLMRKDRVGGALWMNVEEITFEDTPGFYYLRGTRAPVDALSPQALLDNSIGYVALEKNAQLKPVADEETKQVLFDEFVKYKESKHLYNESVGGIDLKQDGNGPSYYTLFDWPYQAPPGQYDITVYESRGGQVIDTATAQLTVDETGVVKTLDDMATQNSALYGAAAVAVALVAGFAVGMIFKGGGAH